MPTRGPSELCVGQIIRRNAANWPKRTAVSLGPAQLTHSELDQLGNQMARQLESAGVKRGQRVVVWAETGLEILPLFVALSKMGAVFAPLNARYGAAEAEPVIELARPSLLITDPEREKQARDFSPALNALSRGRLSQTDDGFPTLRLGGDEATAAFSHEEFIEKNLEENDPHVLFFTSGSTGLPKGVILSHRANWLRSFQGVFIDEPEISVCMFPLFHMAAFTLALSAWQTGGEIALVSEPSAKNLLDAVANRKANRLYCIPAIWKRILDHGIAKHDTSSLRAIDTGTSATPPDLLAALKHRFPQAKLRVYYGSTEAGAGTVLSDADLLAKPGSVGKPAPGVDLQLGEQNEICLRSPCLTEGYFENEAATDSALRDGWFHTGDVGLLDDDGYLFVVGRLNDLIRSGGESIAPTEVEETLSRHPAVEEVAVVGIPDAQWGEVVCAAVVATPGAQPELEELQSHCRQNLAAFKIPRSLILLESLPRTAATGQVQRPLLVEQILAKS